MEEKPFAMPCALEFPDQVLSVHPSPLRGRMCAPKKTNSSFRGALPTRILNFSPWPQVNHPACALLRSVAGEGKVESTCGPLGACCIHTPGLLRMQEAAGVLEGGGMKEARICKLASRGIPRSPRTRTSDLRFRSLCRYAFQGMGTKFNTLLN